MSQESLLTKLANEVLEAAEQLSTRLEEGVAALMSGEIMKTPEAADDSGPSLDDEDDLMMDEDLLGSPLEGIAESVIGDIMGNQVGPQTPMEHLQAFRAAIRWSEPFILSIIAFQVIAFLLCVWASRPSRGLAPRLVVLVCIGILVRSAEWLNGYGARHWQEFATQNYFDRRGIFIGIFVCAPLLLDCFFMLAFYLREASRLLVEVKQMELKKKKEAEKKAASEKKNK